MDCSCTDCKCKKNGIDGVYPEITDSLIIPGEIIFNTPNDMELGKKIRDLYLKLNKNE
jgi:hypothetical protein